MSFYVVQSLHTWHFGCKTVANKLLPQAYIFWGYIYIGDVRFWKFQFWDPLTNCKFEPSSRPHLHSDPSMKTHREQVRKQCMDLTLKALNSTIQVKTHCHTEKQRFGYLWLSKISRHTSLIPRPDLMVGTENEATDTPTETWAQFQKGQPTHCKPGYAFPEFWPLVVAHYSLTQGLEWCLLSKILVSMKMGGA